MYVQLARSCVPPLESKIGCIIPNDRAPSRLAQRPRHRCTPLRLAYIWEVCKHQGHWRTNASEIRSLSQPTVRNNFAKLAVVIAVGDDQHPAVRNLASCPAFSNVPAGPFQAPPRQPRPLSQVWQPFRTLPNVLLFSRQLSGQTANIGPGSKCSGIASER